jgi:hypothetical protein
LIDTVEVDTIEPNVLVQKIRAVDYGFLLTRKTVLKEYSNKTARYVIQDIVKTSIHDDHVGTQCMDAGATIQDISFLYIPLNQALDQLKMMQDCICYVSPYKELRYHKRLENHAAWDISKADAPQKFMEMSAEQTRGKYYNQLVARVRGIIPGEDYFVVVTDDEEVAARQAIEGGTGIYEQYEDLPQVNSINEAINLIIAKLWQASTIGIIITYTTKNSGLRPGTWQYIENEDLGLSETCLITAIEGRIEGLDSIKYTITATTSRAPKDWLSAMQAALDEKSNYKDMTVDEIITNTYTANIRARANNEGVACADTISINNPSMETRIGYIKLGAGGIG